LDAAFGALVDTKKVVVHFCDDLTRAFCELCDDFMKHPVHMATHSPRSARSNAGTVINNSGSVKESIRNIKAACAVLSFYLEAEKLRKPRGVERGDGHHTRHILVATTSLAVKELLSIMSRLITADPTTAPVVVSSKMVGGTAVVRVRAPALTGSEVRRRT
jgi:hypothetical protein